MVMKDLNTYLNEVRLSDLKRNVKYNEVIVYVYMYSWLNYYSVVYLSDKDIIYDDKYRPTNVLRFTTRKGNFEALAETIKNIKDRGSKFFESIVNRPPFRYDYYDCSTRSLRKDIEDTTTTLYPDMANDICRELGKYYEGYDFVAVRDRDEMLELIDRYVK